jgi:hypothetical protein
MPYMRHCHLYEEEDLLLPLATSAPMLDKAHEHIHLYLSRNTKDLKFFFHYDLSAEKETYIHHDLIYVNFYSLYFR